MTPSPSSPPHSDEGAVAQARGEHREASIAWTNAIRLYLDRVKAPYEKVTHDPITRPSSHLLSTLISASLIFFLPSYRPSVRHDDSFGEHHPPARAGKILHSCSCGWYSGPSQGEVQSSVSTDFTISNEEIIRGRERDRDRASSCCRTREEEEDREAEFTES